MSLVARRLSVSSLGALYAFSEPVIVELLSVVAFSILTNDSVRIKIRIEGDSPKIGRISDSGVPDDAPWARETAGRELGVRTTPGEPDS